MKNDELIDKSIFQNTANYVSSFDNLFDNNINNSLSNDFKSLCMIFLTISLIFKIFSKYNS